MPACVAAPPLEGAAGKTLVELLAKTCGIAKSRFGFIAGETICIKRLHLEGDPAALITKLRAG